MFFSDFARTYVRGEATTHPPNILHKTL